MSFEEIISNAGRRNLTVRIKVETRKGQIESFEVEPYGRKQKDSGQMIFCLDVNSYEYKNIDVSIIRAAEMTQSVFKPRFPVDF